MPLAVKRMFSLRVVDTDRFLEMPVSAQCLYFHLGMHADDDGFVDSPRKIARSIGANGDDLKLLIAKNYILPFESGVVAITAWRINNTLKSDRYTETIHTEELGRLTVDPSGQYLLGTTLEPVWNQNGTRLEPNWNQSGTKVEPNWNQNGTKVEPQYSIGKDSIEKDRLGKGREGNGADKPPTREPFLFPSVEAVRTYCEENGYGVDPQRFVDYYTANGWRVGKNPMKDWKATVRLWNGKEDVYERNGNGNSERSGGKQRMGKNDPSEICAIGTIGTVL